MDKRYVLPQRQTNSSSNLYTISLLHKITGRVLQQIVKQIVEKSTNSLKPSTRKIFLYSGHEHTVFSPFAALDLYDHHFPNYASATIYELHKLEDNNYAVKVRIVNVLYSFI